MHNSHFFISQLVPDDELKNIIAEKKCGLELVDFSMASVLCDLDAELKRWEKRLTFIDPPYLSMHGPFLDLNPSTWEPLLYDATMLRYEQAYRAAKALGCETLVFHSCFVPNFNFLEGWPERVIAFYERFLEDKDGSVHIVMENVMDPVPDGFLEIARGINHPAFGICLDVGHAFCYSSVPLSEWFGTLKPYIKHIHLHDNDGTRDAHLAVGCGKIDFEGLAAEIRQIPSAAIECSSSAALVESIGKAKEIYER